MRSRPGPAWVCCAIVSLAACNRQGERLTSSSADSPSSVSTPVEPKDEPRTESKPKPEPEAPPEPQPKPLPPGWARLADAGGERCRASEPIRIGTNHARRSRTGGPYSVPGEPAPSNIQIARVGDSLVAAWPRDDDSIQLQPLSDEGAARGDAHVIEAELAFSLFAFTPHGGRPLALLQSHRRCRENGRRCLDSWWIGPDGHPTGEGLEEYLSEGMSGNKSNIIEAAVLRSDAEGVMLGRAYDDTRQGYAYLACDVKGRAENPASLRCAHPSSTSTASAPRVRWRSRC